MTDVSGPERVRVPFTVNGRAVDVEIDTGDFLLDVLRERLGLTGTKRSCDTQVCGACTVLLDGQPVSSCTVLAWEARGRTVETIEGLARDGRLHPVQEAFLEASAFQCGYCTPGMIMTVKALLDEQADASTDTVRAWLRGNICRCTGYVSILAAVRSAQRRLREARATAP
ncbi:MAG: (2Fe-2S)-binding protein [Candidatus Rokubacteria bacterium]|nr:(2Fe-2S)-binding protein [Candidatus Rokubacteria bacterium]